MQHSWNLNEWAIIKLQLRKESWPTKRAATRLAAVRQGGQHCCLRCQDVKTGAPLFMRAWPPRLFMPGCAADLPSGLAAANASLSRQNHSSLTASWFEILCCSSCHARSKPFKATCFAASPGHVTSDPQAAQTLLVHFPEACPLLGILGVSCRETFQSTPCRSGLGAHETARLLQPGTGHILIRNLYRRTVSVHK